MKTETKCLHSGYEPKSGEPRQLPIYQSTTWKYDSSDDMGKLFDLEASGYFYSRLQNPTCDMVAARVPQGNRRNETSMQLVGGSRFRISQGARAERSNLYNIT